MNFLRTLCFLIAMLSTLSALGQGESVIHHDLDVRLHPGDHRLDVTDRIRFTAGESLVFYLNAALTLEAPPDNVELVSQETNGAVPAKAYRISAAPDQTTLTLRYSGLIDHGLSEEATEYAGSFPQSAGVIADEGVFLAGSSLWYPHVEGRYVSFTLNTVVPARWQTVSQGARQLADDGRVSWRERHAQEEIYLIAAPFHVYSRPAGQVQTMAFLRAEDTALADRYLEVTAQYLAMYNRLLGPYPYMKFALVENFWETGYGMPSFTLLGPAVIRLPFILHSSYPHEIVHNWWGNSVYVDYRQGNWAEGLTSYLADHLIQQQRGTAPSFRRNLLQHYADFVSEGRDFPLAEFTARHSSSSEAVGYGKTQMLFHMLRQRLGDEAFVRGLRRFYRQYQFKQAGFAELAEVFQGLDEADLSGFFEQWVQRTGAPELQVKTVETAEQDDGWRLTVVLQQQQPGAAYRMSVPLAVTLKGVEQAVQTRVEMKQKQQAFSLRLDAKPMRLDVDPQFDLFRRLSRAEIPPALSQAFGAERVLLVLPAAAAAETRAAYETLAASWRQGQSAEVDVRYDDTLVSLPDDRTVWLLGSANRFAPVLVAALAEQGVEHHDGQVILNQRRFDPARDAVVLAARRAGDNAHALVWLAADRAAALPGLARKLPHYRKYSYLVFSGDEPTNALKGQWSVIASPMTVRLAERPIPMAQLESRQALAQLPTASR